MQTHQVDLDRQKARALYREYKKHQHDLWLVVAQWDLSPVEKAALSTRVRA